jgi:aminoglycoside N3'-acetyltransferase
MLLQKALALHETAKYMYVDYCVPGVLILGATVRNTHTHKDRRVGLARLSKCAIRDLISASYRIQYRKT